LKTLYVCHGNPWLSVKNHRRFRSVRGSQEYGFLKHYRAHMGRDGRFEGLAIPAAFEMIKAEVLPNSNPWGVGKEPEVCFVTVVRN